MADGTFDGYTRVTEVLYPFSGMSSIPESVLSNAARRGTRVHSVCESIMKGLGAWDVDEEISGYIDSFNQWWETGIKVVEIEKRFFCDDLKITGQVDLIIDTPSGLNILDLKTPAKPSKTWPLQGSAYAYMARSQGYEITGIQFLQLRKDGKKPKLYQYEDQFELFQKCLDVYNYFYR